MCSASANVQCQHSISIGSILVHFGETFFGLISFLPFDNHLFSFILKEFSCQEVRETSDNDMVIFFATNSDMKRFLSILETIWTTQNVMIYCSLFHVNFSYLNECLFGRQHHFQ